MTEDVHVALDHLVLLFGVRSAPSGQVPRVTWLCCVVCALDEYYGLSREPRRRPRECWTYLAAEGETLVAVVFGVAVVAGAPVALVLVLAAGAGEGGTWTRKDSNG